MRRNKITCIICQGFNHYFDVPKVVGRKPATHRTAIVIKMMDFDDEWDVYDAMFWRIVQRIALDLNASIRIQHPESGADEMQSLEELRSWQKQQAATDSEFVIDMPTEIRFFNGDGLLCLMTLEDWSATDKIEPYSCSYTFSFYSDKKGVDESINDSITTQLSHEEKVGEIITFHECNSPKWYWPLLNIFRGDAFFYCAGLGVLAVFAIVMIIISPSPATYNKMAQARRFLKKARTVLLAADGKTMTPSFAEWRMTQGIASSNVPLAVLICKYCKEYSRLSGHQPLGIREIDGAERLIDPWGNPYNAGMLRSFQNENTRMALVVLSVHGIVMWSSGPNGINEEGEGDDIFELPRSQWQMSHARYDGNGNAP